MFWESRAKMESGGAQREGADMRERTANVQGRMVSRSRFDQVATTAIFIEAKCRKREK
jgi:hypothetical protein